jgi:hypothetical protein
MSEQALVNLTVDPQVIKPVIEQKVHAAILQALGGEELVMQTLSHLVAGVLNEKVDKEGNKPRYSGDAKYIWIQVLCRNALKDMIKRAVQDFIQSKEAILTKEIERQLASHKSEIAKAFVDSLAQATAKSWGFNVTLQLDSE